MVFVKIIYAHVIKAIVENNASLHNSFLSKFTIKKIKSLISSFLIIQTMIQKPFKLYPIWLSNQAH